MGILNVTPDSFSDGGQFYQHNVLTMDSVKRKAEQMVKDGAKILDVGGESTRPGASPITTQEEMDRVLPVIELLRQLDVIISLDSSDPKVIQAAVGSGIGLINDVRALRKKGATEVAAHSGLPVCLMHMQGDSPKTMQDKPSYQSVVDDVIAFLTNQVDRCVSAGIDKHRILLDPGFGFGKTLRHNLTLLNRLDQLVALGYPVLSGSSRKSMLGLITGREPGHRLAASLSSAIIAAQKGAAIIRVHDVAETVDALNVWKATREEHWES
jgi:dihydropteroate synthase